MLKVVLLIIVVICIILFLIRVGKDLFDKGYLP